MSGNVGPKTQFFSYRVDLPGTATTYIIEWEDSDGVNQKNTYLPRKTPISFILNSCVTYGTFIVNGSRIFAIDDPCPGNNICVRTNLITNNGKC
jgi:hypothetical protein